jgi:hypothetical protein
MDDGQHRFLKEGIQVPDAIPTLLAYYKTTKKNPKAPDRESDKIRALLEFADCMEDFEWVRREEHPDSWATFISRCVHKVTVSPSLLCPPHNLAAPSTVC